MSTDRFVRLGAILAAQHDWIGKIRALGIATPCHGCVSSIHHAAFHFDARSIKALATKALGSIEDWRAHLTRIRRYSQRMNNSSGYETVPRQSRLSRVIQYPK